MKKNLILILALGSALLSFTCISCLENNQYPENVVRFVYEPVVIKIDSSKTVLRTQYGEIQAPQLNGKVSSGQYYLTNFTIDKTIRPYTAFDLELKRMGVDTVSLVGGLTEDDYKSSLSDLKLYLQDPNASMLTGLDKATNSLKFICIDSTFFISPWFENDGVHEFELLAPGDSIDKGSGFPILYLRAKPSTNEYSKSSYALNLSALLRSSKYKDKKEISFYLKYKSGEKATGESIYADYKNNPVQISYSK